MSVSVIIPSRAGDRTTLRALIASLAAQTRAPARIILSIDDESAPAPPIEALTCAGIETTIVRGANAGPAAARNRALKHVCSGLVVLFNDDVVADPDCIERHIEAHARSECPSLVVGAAPWRFERSMRVIDRLVAETSMIFFYDKMSESDAGRDWGFRHAWTLNLSCPAELAQAFDERLRYPMFDDLEWAFRVTRHGAGAPVRFCPAARVAHEHAPAYSAASLARRETLIGHQARALRDINRACFRETFGTDAAPTFVARADRREGAAAFKAFAALAEEPGDACDVATLFEACLPWRDAARAIGWRAADRGAPFEHAAAETRAAFRGASTIAA